MVFFNAGMVEEKGTTDNNQRDYAEGVIGHFEMKACNPACTPGEGPKFSCTSQNISWWTRGTGSVTNRSRVLSCILGKFPLRRTSFPLISWKGLCQGIQKPT